MKKNELRLELFISGSGTTAEAVIKACRRGRIINQHPEPLDPSRDDFGGKGMYGAWVSCARLIYEYLPGEVLKLFVAGKVKSYHRSSPLISAGKEKIFYQAKGLAIEIFPKG